MPVIINFSITPHIIVKTDRKKNLMKGVEKLREEQNYLREEVKRLKWQEGISYKYLAEELLDMKYNSFVNFVNGYKDLGYTRTKILKGYIEDMI